MNPASLAPSPVPAAGQQAPLAERHAATPRLACEALARAINRADLQAALECFAPAATLVWADGSAASGGLAIRERLAELVSAGAQIEIELSGVLVAGDLALAHERWRIAYGAKRSRTPESSQPTLVLRLAEGEWQVAIACPWGAAASPALQAI